MLTGQIQYSEIDSLKLASTLMQPSPGSISTSSFEEILDKEIKEVVKKSKDEATDITNQTILSIKKKKEAKLSLKDGLPDISKLVNAQEKASHELKNTYELLEQFKKEKTSLKDDGGLREQVLSNANNVAGQALVQPVNDQSKRRMSKEQLLNAWEKFTPQVTEDPLKKSVRIDIPLLNDIQALVLRINPDKSVSASMLASKEMSELMTQNKEQLKRNLNHHHLSLKEFNTYHSELEFNSESGTKKNKKKKQTAAKPSLDLV